MRVGVKGLTNVTTNTVSSRKYTSHFQYTALMIKDLSHLLLMHCGLLLCKLGKYVIKTITFILSHPGMILHQQQVYILVLDEGYLLQFEYLFP